MRRVQVTNKCSGSSGGNQILGARPRDWAVVGAALGGPLAAALVACASPNRVRIPGFPLPLGLTRERVVGRGAWLDVSKAPEGYRSVTSAPLTGPYYILISLSSRYCVVDERDYTRALDGQLWACEWHFLRPSAPH